MSRCTSIYRGFQYKILASLSVKMSKIEDVLLVLPQVRYKKADGTLFIMKERIAFIMENRDSVQIAHSFYEIKSEFIIQA